MIILRRWGNPKVFKKLYDQALAYHHNRRMLVNPDPNSSEDSSRQIVRVDFEEDKHYFKPEINKWSREIVEAAKQKLILETEKPKYVFDSLYHDFYVKKHEAELRQKQMSQELQQMA